MKQLLWITVVAAWFIALPPASTSPNCNLNAPLNQWLIVSLPFSSPASCRANILDELKFLRTLNPPQSLNPQCTQCLSTDQIIRGR